jgi:hypothetical protein
VTGWLPTLPEDRDVPERGYVQLLDPETGEAFHAVIDASLRREMRRQLELLGRRQQHLFAQCGCPLVCWPAPAADDFRLAAWIDIVSRCAR